MIFLERQVTALARWMAILGGLVLVAITLITVVSITGRALIFIGLKPVPGDFELVEAGTAFAIFAFIPWCLLNRGHATVDLLAARFPHWLNATVDVISHALMLCIAIVIAWRHFLGTVDKYNYGETTFILQFPIWWAYAASLVGASVFILVAAFCLLRSVIEFRNKPSTDVIGDLR